MDMHCYRKRERSGLNADSVRPSLMTRSKFTKVSRSPNSNHGELQDGAKSFMIL